MNCPSRTDDITLEHPDWNQNPPFLAADLTTCEDLNGIANAREHRRATDGAGDGSDGRGDEMNYQTLPRLQPDRRFAVSGGWKYCESAPGGSWLISLTENMANFTKFTNFTPELPQLTLPRSL